MDHNGKTARARARDTTKDQYNSELCSTEGNLAQMKADVAVVWVGFLVFCLGAVSRQARGRKRTGDKRNGKRERIK